MIGLVEEVLTDSTGLFDDAPITGVTEIEPAVIADFPFAEPAHALTPIFIEIESEPAQLEALV